MSAPITQVPSKVIDVYPMSSGIFTQVAPFINQRTEQQNRVEKVSLPSILEKAPSFPSTATLSPFPLLPPSSDFFQLLKDKTSKIHPPVYLQKFEVSALYPQIPCPKLNAVSIKGKFLHANFVFDKEFSRTFVASQFPYEKALFWKFILENDFSIIDLTQKQFPYYPTLPNRPCIFDDISVKLTSVFEENAFKYTHKYTVIAVSSSETRTITRTHFTEWSTEKKLDLAWLDFLVDTLDGEDLGGKTLVHCGEGLNRTGTLITAYFLKKQILQKKICMKTLEAFTVNLIVWFREQRGLGWVAEEDQQVLLLRYGQLLINKQTQYI